MDCKKTPECEVKCNECKSFYERMYDKNHKDDDDIDFTTAFEWTEYMVDWANKQK